MKINTKNFGEIEISEDDIIIFDQPIYGFDNYKKYFFILDDSLNGEFMWLQSVDNTDLCFVLANPCNLSEGYSPELPENVEQLIGRGTYELWLIMVVTDEFCDSTVNLKSPIFVNLSEKRAAQIILEEDFPIRHKLFDNVKEDMMKC